jgi:hypothetical protein
MTWAARKFFSEDRLRCHRKQKSTLHYRIRNKTNSCSEDNGIEVIWQGMLRTCTESLIKT